LAALESSDVRYWRYRRPVDAAVHGRHARLRHRACSGSYVDYPRKSSLDERQDQERAGEGEDRGRAERLAAEEAVSRVSNGAGDEGRRGAENSPSSSSPHVPLLRYRRTRVVVRWRGL
jgi:hypothetical protein